MKYVVTMSKFELFCVHDKHIEVQPACVSTYCHGLYNNLFRDMELLKDKIKTHKDKPDPLDEHWPTWDHKEEPWLHSQFISSSNKDSILCKLSDSVHSSEDSLKSLPERECTQSKVDIVCCIAANELIALKLITLEDLSTYGRTAIDMAERVKKVIELITTAAHVFKTYKLSCERLNAVLSSHEMLTERWKTWNCCCLINMHNVMDFSLGAALQMLLVVSGNTVESFKLKFLGFYSDLLQELIKLDHLFRPLHDDPNITKQLELVINVLKQYVLNAHCNLMQLVFPGGTVLDMTGKSVNDNAACKLHGDLYCLYSLVTSTKHIVCQQASVLYAVDHCPFCIIDNSEYEQSVLQERLTEVNTLKGTLTKLEKLLSGISLSLKLHSKIRNPRNDVSLQDRKLAYRLNGKTIPVRHESHSCFLQNQAHAIGIVGGGISDDINNGDISSDESYQYLDQYSPIRNLSEDTDGSLTLDTLMAIDQGILDVTIEAPSMHVQEEIHGTSYEINRNEVKGDPYGTANEVESSVEGQEGYEKDNVDFVLDSGKLKIVDVDSLNDRFMEIRNCIKTAKAKWAEKFTDQNKKITQYKQLIDSNEIMPPADIKDCIIEVGAFSTGLLQDVGRLMDTSMQVQQQQREILYLNVVDGMTTSGNLESTQHITYGIESYLADLKTDLQLLCSQVESIRCQQQIELNHMEDMFVQGMGKQSWLRSERQQKNHQEINKRFDAFSSFVQSVPDKLQSNSREFDDSLEQFTTRIRAGIKSFLSYTAGENSRKQTDTSNSSSISINFPQQSNVLSFDTIAQTESNRNAQIINTASEVSKSGIHTNMADTAQLLKTKKHEEQLSLPQKKQYEAPATVRVIEDQQPAVGPGFTSSMEEENKLSGLHGQQNESGRDEPKNKGAKVFSSGLTKNDQKLYAQLDTRIGQLRTKFGDHLNQLEQFVENNPGQCKEFESDLTKLKNLYEKQCGNCELALKQATNSVMLQKVRKEFVALYGSLKTNLKSLQNRKHEISKETSVSTMST